MAGGQRVEYDDEDGIYGNGMKSQSEPRATSSGDMTVLSALFQEARGSRLRHEIESDRARFSDPSNAICLFGAGNTGREMAALLRKMNIPVAAFIDDTPQKQDTKLDGIPIMARQKALSMYGSRAVAVVTIYRHGHRYLDTRAALLKIGFASVCSFTHVVRAFPEVGAPCKCFHAPEAYIPFEAMMESVWQKLEDAESRAEYERQLRFRLLLDYECIRPSGHPIYFDPSVLPPLPEEGFHFTDCGAYDGDTIRQFLAWCDHRFQSILALEPDPQNYEKLTAAVAAMPVAVKERIRCVNSAVGEKTGEALFDASGTMGSSLSDRGTQRIKLVALDDAVSKGRGHFIKFDVEGAERDALKGLARTMRAEKPVLAVSAYHLFDDLWVLPLYLLSQRPDYRLYLRAYAEEAMDCVFYAIP